MSTKSAAIEMSEAAASTPAQVAPVMSRPSTSTTAGVPREAVRLDLLLIGGQRHLFDFTPSTTVKEVRETVYDEWPKDWPSKPASSSALRLLHWGHILDDKAVLSGTSSSATPASSMRVGGTTVVHLLIKAVPVRDNDGDDDSLKKDVQSSCCCVIC